ncbi:MAG TPA: DUF2330 domain-containing protein [Mycobacteriales bacterium]|nr:DUF2330 domain-containing protein [Mycobacteriales bacterium]
MTTRRAVPVVSALAAALVLGAASPALACGGLIGPNGAVNLLTTTTLAGYHDGIEHYVTSFEFAGGGGAFGSIIPLPGVPTSVVRGGDWTLQRLERETEPQPLARTEAVALASGAADSAQVILKTTIDALDITVLKGGGDEVGVWAKENGFRLPPDAPEVLDFYAERSQIFLAASFDAQAAADRGQQLGDGTPVHVTIPTDNPWVPLRILGLGKSAEEPVNADVYVLTDTRPAFLPAPRETLPLLHDAAATPGLLADLRSDKGMEWVPESAWLSKIRVAGPAGELVHDLAIDASGQGRPSRVAAGLAPVSAARPIADEDDALPAWLLVAVVGIVLAGAVVAGPLARRLPTDAR